MTALFAWVQRHHKRSWRLGKFRVSVLTALMEFETYLAVVRKDWTRIKATGKERQRPRYNRNGKQQVVRTVIDSLYFTETVTDVEKGSASVKVQLLSKSNDMLQGVYFAILLPAQQYGSGDITINNLPSVKLAGAGAALENTCTHRTQDSF